MEHEITQNSIIPISLLLTSLAYSYFLAPYIPKGPLRVLSYTPIFYIFFLIPWYSSSSFLRGILSFFITWITSFKLLLFCFNRGFLFSCKTYIDFVLVAIFPIKMKEINGRYELLQLFDKPYLAKSLQEFWGRRWNRLASYVLRQTIYVPTQNSLKGVVGNGAAKMGALVITLVVSGVMHELMFYYITCGKRPTWECAHFFVLQGVCMVLEAGFRYFWRWKPFHPLLPNFFTLGFVVTTFYWLLVVPVWRSGQSKCNFKPKGFFLKDL
ncbi:acyl-CoA--sterol O-acyltransferase 1-like [Euphorbia lathyris]|uniref:acyl-CoA--sterol O-acyltransferase 1-like n=1 Tax=Euphorbia lathyris TaxID=212925 RepID=UPI003313A4C7